METPSSSGSKTSSLTPTASLASTLTPSGTASPRASFSGAVTRSQSPSPTSSAPAILHSVCSRHVECIALAYIGQDVQGHADLKRDKDSDGRALGCAYFERFVVRLGRRFVQRRVHEECERERQRDKTSRRRGVPRQRLLHVGARKGRSAREEAACPRRSTAQRSRLDATPRADGAPPAVTRTAPAAAAARRLIAPCHEQGGWPRGRLRGHSLRERHRQERPRHAAPLRACAARAAAAPLAPRRALRSDRAPRLARLHLARVRAHEHTCGATHSHVPPAVTRACQGLAGRPDELMIGQPAMQPCMT